MSQGNVIRRMMWRIEKFAPHQCLKCEHQFNQEERDYFLYVGNMALMVKKPKKSRRTFTVIICAKCHNFTMQVMLETRHLFSEKRAKHYIKQEGFTNLRKVPMITIHPLKHHERHFVYQTVQHAA